MCMHDARWEVDVNNSLIRTNLRVYGFQCSQVPPATRMAAECNLETEYGDAIVGYLFVTRAPHKAKEHKSRTVN